jgi:hypothetical protein
MKPPRCGEVFAEWNKGDLDSFLIEITADILQQKDPDDRQAVRRHRPRHRRPEGHRQVDQRQRARHGRARADGRRGGLRPLPLRRQGGARGRLADPQGPEGKYRATRQPSSRRSTTRSTARRSAPTPRASSSCARRRRSTTGSSTSARSPDLARRLHHPRGLPAEDHRGLRPQRRPGEPAARPLLQERGREGAGQLAQGRRRRAECGIPPRRFAAPSPTTTATAANACPPTCSRASATTSAPTPTSAPTSRAASSSTSTGPRGGGCSGLPNRACSRCGRTRGPRPGTSGNAARLPSGRRRA